MSIIIPSELKPVDGRFGCGPSKIRPEALASLSASGNSIVGTSHRQKPVKNVDLWQRLEEASARHQVTWQWIKGHAGHVENEKADELARLGMEPFKSSRSVTAPSVNTDE